MPHTLGVLRVIAGVMLLYSHLVLASDLSSFLGETAWMSNETARQLHDGAFGFSDYGRSYLWYIGNPLLLWLHHGLTILITASFAAGFMTRITAPAAWFLQLMYLHRMTGTLFGFDQIVTYTTMYLMLAPSGSCFSVDAWLRERWAARRANSRRLQFLLPEATPSVAANIATRLLQLHLCVIYLFGGLAKARGELWWDGTATWYSIGNYEYQSMDMTWLANYPRLFSAMTHATLFWEIFYCALIWPRRSRPIALAIAFAVHGGIAAFLGMITFGLMMIGANLVFIRPEQMLRLLRRGKAIDEQSDSLDDSPKSGTSDSPAAVLETDAPIEDHDEGDAQDQEDEFDEDFSLDDLGLEELGLDSNASDILKRADSDASASGILQNQSEREAALARREERIRNASQRLREKKEQLNANLEKYGERVERLKKREAKIKKLVDRKRKKE
jgi:hypothetical protein